MIIKLDINDRAALAIKNNKKRVEIRANDNKYDYSKLNSNDIIEFNSNNIGIFYVKIKEVNFYNSLEELFMLEGTRYTTSSTNDYNEAINNVNKLDGYKEAIRKNGVYAIHIEYLYSVNTVWEELIEKANNNEAVGYSDNYLKVKIENKTGKILENNIYSVKIVEIQKNMLIGELV